jgi:hypothetical protein
MKLLPPRLSAVVGVALCLATAVPAVNAEMLPNTFGNGGDVVVRRNNSGRENDGFLRIKTQSGDTETNGNDRIGLLKFDLTALTEPVTNAAVRLELPRGQATGHPNNTFDPGETLYLYGIPDAATGEDFDEATINFASSPYLTGAGSATNPRPITDATANGVNDDLAVLLDTYTFTATSDAGELVDFQSAALTTYLQADTNGIASFILTVSQGTVAKTGVFVSDTGTEGTPLPPTLLTNADAPVPEPAAAVLFSMWLLGGQLVRGRNQRCC